MFAYMFSAARLGIRHMMIDFLQDQPSYHKVRVAPVLHYSLNFKLSNGVSWGKGMPDADGEPLAQLLKATLPDDADEVVTGACCASQASFSPLLTAIRHSFHRLLASIQCICLVASVRHRMGERAEAAVAEDSQSRTCRVLTTSVLCTTGREKRRRQGAIQAFFGLIMRHSWRWKKGFGHKRPTTC
jgi:hypothetical protein